MHWAVIAGVDALTIRPSRTWAERKYPNLIHWGEPERGGHFAAFEQPKLFVREMRAFARAMR